ncbi:hypothetical protein B296_00011420 [Ensete ventricosum]|uniref:Uncharacterized protein n=1 Tax=Ensete ventricosum TaxID=4639 RepID=A0A426ZNT9_ENSVE|nr:hypothetical protein B296_00011420 [Ensete ventricosum]
MRHEEVEGSSRSDWGDRKAQMKIYQALTVRHMRRMRRSDSGVITGSRSLSPTVQRDSRSINGGRIDRFVALRKWFGVVVVATTTVAGSSIEDVVAGDLAGGLWLS